MAKEIERRFLVKEGFDPAGIAERVIHINQSYLPNTGDWTVRVRREAHEFEGRRDREVHILTFKKFVSGATNIEIETQISEEAYDDFMTQTKSRLVKTRYIIWRRGFDNKDRRWEVDVYPPEHPDFQTIAEIELGDEHEELDIPHWAVREVTGDRSFSNVALAERLTQS